MRPKRRRRVPSGTERHYRSLLAELARSGQSVREFAREQGLSPWTLYTWRSRLGLARGRASRRKAAGGSGKSATGRLLEVSVAAASPPGESQGLVLCVHGRHRLELPRDIAEADLVRILRALSSC